MGGQVGSDLGHDLPKQDAEQHEDVIIDAWGWQAQQGFHVTATSVGTGYARLGRDEHAPCPPGPQVDGSELLIKGNSSTQRWVAGRLGACSRSAAALQPEARSWCHDDEGSPPRGGGE